MNNRIKIVVMAATMLILASLLSVFAQVRQEPLTVYAGSVVYNNPAFETDPVVDFPFTIKRHELEFFKPDTMIDVVQARVYAAVVIYGMDGLPMDSSSTYFSVMAACCQYFPIRTKAHGFYVAGMAFKIMNQSTGCHIPQFGCFVTTPSDQNPSIGT